ncbi:toprim domain-containing protein [Acinetobacter larvae]|uniref:Toprim domain-containing protein n=1 Tax=Acinetobacter larvae TaxID=1789224 RepID=A0A1B2LYZ6_9GAMM|nr:toprim domain-containing protein [Acinetobacter larvae]AOA58155.1 hypothetical protein BFG52_07160 [Acinetobacter larvae]
MIIIPPTAPATLPLLAHLHKRNFSPDLYHNIVLDHCNQRLTVYLNNLSGQFVGYQQYNPRCSDKTFNLPHLGRYYTVVTAKQIALWGLETLKPQQKICFVVEGIFKAACLHQLGYNAIAVLCNNPVQMHAWFYAMPYQFIAIGDADQAGEQLVKCVGHGTVFAKDLDEYAPADLDLALQHYLNQL